MHEAFLSSFSSKYEVESVDKMVIEITNVMVEENEKPENSQGVEQLIKFKDGRIYEGTIKNGRKNGKGRLSFPNGDVYDGFWKNGERHGFGEYFWKSGAKYEGQYSHNQRHG